ncbi:Vacuolar inheritance and morphology protein [Vermiconidia calcicola]|uniref:Vacuolar inheritance and morphology protein n=1 Tax=Vermiconidia calcicola TaxID=1690605 RepID=A0ACC3MY53_9PEZI|nr:Vacuolar inheritance and morphology protein [Vermiconidia calcicola]
MANNNPEPESTNGQAETSAPGNTTASTSASRRSSQNEARKPSTTAVSSPLSAQKQTLSTLVPLATTSAGTSPRTSRNASPTRKDSRTQPLSNPISTQPSAAAIQRALSAANFPQLPGGASGDTTPRWPTSPRLTSPPPSGANSRRNSSTAQQKKPEVGAAAPSINVQSATPQASTPPAPPKQSTDETSKLQTPSKGPSRGPSGKSTLETVQEISADDVKDPSPAAVKAAADLKPLTKITEEVDKVNKQESHGAGGENSSNHGESGSESAGTKTEKKKDLSSSTQRPKTAQAKSYASLASTKSRQPEGKQNMTVETETVPSIPQSAMNAGDRSAGIRNDNSGSIRLKASNETIRPKKERKKATQKARSITQGTGTYLPVKSPLLTSQAHFDNTQHDAGAESSQSSSTAREVSNSEPGSPPPRRNVSYSQHLKNSLSLQQSSSLLRKISNRYLRKASSKADIFENRVANAMDEANSSDSDETFVYESNPPEAQRPARHHSRTPSITSSHSIAEGQRSAGMRSFGDVMDERRVAGKRSMKFSNNAFNDIDSPESKDGSVRSHQPRHFGRFGRGGSHASMFDQDSPFTQASKLRSNQLSLRQSRPNSPKSPYSAQQQRSSGLFGKKQEPSSFDFDAEGGDDERTPLMGTVRTPRGGRLPRRITNTSNHSIDEYYGVRRQPRCGRFGGCLLGFIVFAAVILSAVAFLVMSNRPMYDVKVQEIQNVLASEQELMLDLLVGAVNPNALGITVTDMDVRIFAKSKHVGTSAFWREHAHAPLTTSASVSTRKRRRRNSPRSQPPTSGGAGSWQDLSHHWRSITGGVDEGTDPDDDLEGDAQTMLLGRIFHFDQSLSFEGSPLKRHSHSSTGEISLEKPGNKTETGGSARWENVLQYPFELIIRGTLKYQLPISSRTESAGVGASILVHPEDGVDESGNMRVHPVDHREDWQWIEWDDVEGTARSKEGKTAARVVELADEYS